MSGAEIAVPVFLMAVEYMASSSAARKGRRAQGRANRQALEYQARSDFEQKVDWRNQNKVDQWNGEWNRRLTIFNTTVSQKQTDQRLAAGYGVPGRIYGGTVAAPYSPAKPTFEDYSGYVSPLDKPKPPAQSLAPPNPTQGGSI